MCSQKNRLVLSNNEALHKHEASRGNVNALKRAQTRTEEVNHRSPLLELPPVQLQAWVNGPIQRVGASMHITGLSTWMRKPWIMTANDPVYRSKNKKTTLYCSQPRNAQNWETTHHGRPKRHGHLKRCFAGSAYVQAGDQPAEIWTPYYPYRGPRGILPFA